MRIQLALAFSISVVLVSAASWWRFSRVEYERPALTIVEELDAYEISDEDFLKDFTATQQAGSAVSPSPQTRENMSDTDMLSRQMMLDYIELSASGQITQKNIDSLITKYVDQIPNLGRVELLSTKNLTLVEDNAENFQKYADALTLVHKNYSQSLAKNYFGQNINSLSPETYSLINTFSSAYSVAAESLRQIAVPNSLAEIHLKLLNSYLESSSATKTLSQDDSDPASAFAGLIKFKTNAAEEESIRAEITQLLTSKGI